MKLRGHFKLAAVKNGVAVRRCEFDNVVCTGGLDYIYSCPKYSDGNGYYLGECQVGISNAAPASTDLQLGSFAQVAPVVNSDYAHPNLSLETVNGITSWVCSYQYVFAAGSIVDVIREIGIAPYHPSGTPVNLFSRALIHDQFDMPSEFTIHGDESLEVIYELRVVLDPTTIQFDVTGQDNFDTFPVHCILGAGNVSQIPPLGRSLESNPPTIYVTDGPIGNMFEAPHGDVTQVVNGTYKPYVPGSFSVDASFYVSEVTGNFDGGVSSLMTRTNFHSLQLQMKPSPIKTTSKQLRLGFKYNWGISP